MFASIPPQITEWKQQLLARAADVLGGSKPMAEMPDLTTLHAKIGQLALMRRIDALDLAHPFAGVRMLRDLLQRDGHVIGRRHVATLMRRMGIEAVYRKPHTS